MTKEEWIVCSAIWYKDLPDSRFLPINIKSGTIVYGPRHGHCIATMMQLAGKRTVQFGENSVGETEQGFWTTHNRFVGRLEALEIAIAANQLKEGTIPNKHTGLFSEDLY